MELLRFYFAIFFILFVNGQIPFDPFNASEDTIPLLGPRFADKSATLTYAAVRDISIRPFRKRPPALQYQVELENETFNVTLLQNEGLTSPGCLVHHYALNGRKKLYPCNRRRHKCFYTGKSDSHNDSWVAADVCNGLRGVLSIGNMSYFFDPMTSNSSRINGGHVHTVYRFQGDKHICAVNDLADLHVVHDNRGKRDIIDQSATKYVETRVVIDPHMVLYHGSSDITEHYAYMAFNIANKVFKHKSLGQTVQLVINEFYIIEPFDDFTSSLTPVAGQTLGVFCKWQQQLPGTVDANVLFTRMNIRDNASDAVNGLSYPKSMCNNDWNCALVEDQGPIFGITVAHEIGHLLGMKHNPAGLTGIMNAGGWSGQEAFQWSNQSAFDFLAHATKPEDPLRCLRNRPLGMSSKRDTTPPGIFYSADKQCQLMYNDTAYFVQNTKQDVCRNLFCAFTDSANIVTSSTPLIDGTDCYNNRSWCLSGKCVPIEAEYNYSVSSIDGVWSAWSPYTQCSRTCDGGVQIRRRSCNNPMPQFGGKECIGSDRQVKLCNMESCSPTRNDDRDKQCQSHKLANVTDVYCSSVTGSRSCESTVCPHGTTLGCHRFPHEYGTECWYNDAPYNRCVENQCMSFGCDGISDSKMVYDNCGVCNGTGTSCDIHTDNYDNNGLYKRYADVVTIPAMSSHITVTQWNRYCFMSIAVNGTRIFNDNGTQQRQPLATTLFGIHLRYSRYPERIQIVPKIPTDIVIQVYRKYGPTYRNASPNVTYSFYTNNRAMMYAWAIVPNSLCSKECGTGQKMDDIRCMGSGWKQVDDMYCEIESKPKVVPKPCNTHGCPPKWVATPWSKCSVPCGTGIKTRNVTCTVETHGTEVVVSDIHCQRLKNHPVVESQCYIKSNCTGTWVTGNWSKCSTTCGEGKQTRTVECKVRHGLNSYSLKDTDCVSHRPTEVDKCNHGPCYVTSTSDDTCTDVSGNCEYFAIGAALCGSINSHKACPKTCGVCTNRNCYDEPLCDYFQPSDCGMHLTVVDFLSQNCSQKCGLCHANTSCDDTPVCESIKPTHCRQTTVSLTNFLFQNCPQKCGVCNADSRCFDAEICNMYDSIYCGDPQYATWMYRNCPQSCGVCRDCMDCSGVNLADCTKPDRVLQMKKYCSKTCKFCHGNVLQG